jgi:1-deoxy-D-xylulose 5-phosphate reductoisomerase
VSKPATSTGLVNGFAPLVESALSAIHATMIPIDSYHDAVFES